MTNEIAVHDHNLPVPVGAVVEHGFRQGEVMFGQVGKHMLIHFRNGWTLSIIDAWGSYGVEAGLINPQGDMPFDSPVFPGDSVEGWLSPERLAEIIAKVDEL